MSVRRTTQAEVNGSAPSLERVRQILRLPSELMGSLTERRSWVATVIQACGNGAEDAGRRTGLVMGSWSLSKAILDSGGLVVGVMKCAIRAEISRRDRL